MATKRPKGLGRGLDVLLGKDVDVVKDLGQAPAADAVTQDSQPATLPLDRLQAGKYQPRTRMDDGSLMELAESIRAQGIMQPILVRPLPAAGRGVKRYEIIAGERRFRAANLAGLETVPVLVREVPDDRAAVMALIENIQREDLNPLEEAQGVKRLLDEFGMTHELAAQAIGRSRSATTNLLRLLNLAEPVQTMLMAGDIDMGHARALVAVDAAGQIQLAHEVVARRLSVRETEKRVNRYQEEADGQSARSRNTPEAAQGGDQRRLETALSDLLGTKVAIRAGTGQRGQLQVDFHGWEHLNTLLERMGLNKAIEEDA